MAIVLRNGNTKHLPPSVEGGGPRSGGGRVLKQTKLCRDRRPRLSATTQKLLLYQRGELPPSFSCENATSLYTREAFCVFAQTRRGALCASVSVGKVTSPMESHKDFFVDLGTLCGFCPFRFTALPKLHSNYSGISASLFTKCSRETASAFDGAPLLFGITAKFHARRDDV